MSEGCKQKMEEARWNECSPLRRKGRRGIRGTTSFGHKKISVISASRAQRAVKRELRCRAWVGAVSSRDRIGGPTVSTSRTCVFCEYLLITAQVPPIYRFIRTFSNRFLYPPDSLQITHGGPAMKIGTNLKPCLASSLC